MRLWLVLLAALPLLAVGSGATASNSTPPRNGLIAINGGNGGLYLVDPGTGAATPVAAAEEAAEVAWSPDGTHFAYTLWSRDADTPSVYTMKPDGSDSTLVARNASSPTWSPDGQSLALVRDTYTKLGGEGTELVVVSATGKDERVILPGAASTTPIFLSTPAWSPDGKLIAFVDDQGRIGLVTPSGQRGAVFDVDATATSLSWSPDSSRLAFDGYRESKSGSRDFVVVLELATGNETLLAGEEQGAQAPEWSPEGDQIAFLSMRLRSHPATTSHCAAEPYETHLWSMRPDGTKAHPLAEAVLFGRPSWGRAGETISLPVPGTPPKPSTSSQPEPTPVAPTPTASSAPTPKPASDPPHVATPKPTSGTATRPAPTSTLLGGASGLISVRGKGGIYVVDPKGAKARALPGTNRMWAPAWSPSMKELAVEVAEKGGGSSIYTISADGMHPHLVLENASAPSWSADGSRIFAVRSECSRPCASDDDAADVLYVVSPDGTGAQRVDLGDAEAYDSRELAWPVDGNAIHFFDEESLSGPGTFDSAEATWSPDQTELAFTGALGASEDESANNGLWVVSAEGGTPTLLLSGAVGRPSWAAR